MAAGEEESSKSPPPPSADTPLSDTPTPSESTPGADTISAKKDVPDGDVDFPKGVKMRFRAVAGTPQLKKSKFMIPSNEKWASVIQFLQKNLKLDDHQTPFLYVRASFSPSPSDHIGAIWRHFRTGDEVIVHYALAPAYG